MSTKKRKSIFRALFVIGLSFFRAGILKSVVGLISTAIALKVFDKCGFKICGY